MNKEELRKRRREAYRATKAMRDADPKYQALKEKMKKARKAKYRAFQEQNKKAKEEARQKEKAEKDAILMRFFVSD